MREHKSEAEKIVHQALTELKGRGFMYHESFGRNGRITSFSHYSKLREIEIIFTSGYALNEEKQKLYFSEDNLEEEMSRFHPSKKTDTIFHTIPTSEVAVTKKEPTEKMSESKNNFGEMRKSLFEALRKLESGEMKPEAAKAMSQTAQTIINSVKVELEVRLQASKLPKMNVIEG